MKYLYINRNDVGDQYIDYFGPIPSSIEVTKTGEQATLAFNLSLLSKLAGLSGEQKSGVETTKEVRTVSDEYLANRVLGRARRDRRVIREKRWKPIARQIYRARTAPESPRIVLRANFRIEGSEDFHGWKENFEAKQFVKYRLHEGDPLHESLASYNVVDLTMGSSAKHMRLGELIGGHGFLLPAFREEECVPLSVFGWLWPARSDEHGFRPYIKPILIWL